MFNFFKKNVDLSKPKEVQREIVLRILMEGKVVDTREMIYKHGITRLSSIIHKLRKTFKIVTLDRKYGHCARYQLYDDAIINNEKKFN